MSSETITRNDLEAILNEVLPSKDRMELLWTNPNPDINFAGQTITIDLSDYDMVEIHFFESSNAGRRFGMSQRFLKDIPCMMRSFSNMSSGSASSLLQRRLQASDTGVVFQDGQYRGATATAAPSTGNDVLVPLRIYGVSV